MSLFPTIYSRFADDRRVFPSVSGSRFKITKHLVYDDRGVQTLKVVGKSDLYSEIQSHRESTDLSMILSRIDPYQVNNMASTYSFNDLLDSEIIDVTTLPKNAGDMLNLVRKGQQLFDGLPIEIREEFNFSAEKFISSFGSKDFADKINYLNAKANGQSSAPIYDVSKNGRIKRHTPNDTISVVENSLDLNVENSTKGDN